MDAPVANRPWLADRRAFILFGRWRRGRRTPQDYTQLEYFREWASITCNHFFDVTAVWSDKDVLACAIALGVEPPPQPRGMLDSWSEDEVICRSQEGRILLYHDRVRNDRPRAG